MKNTLKKYAISGMISLAFVAVGCNDGAGNKPDGDNKTSLNDTDKEFVKMAAIGNNAEIEAGRLAASKATDPSVKSFAEMMVTDHTKALGELKSVAKDEGLTLSDTLDQKHTEMKATLESLTGRAFDSAYSHGMVEGHNSTIALFEDESNKGGSEKLKAFATKTLPTLKMHKMHIDSIAPKY